MHDRGLLETDKPPHFAHASATRTLTEHLSWRIEEEQRQRCIEFVVPVHSIDSVFQQVSTVILPCQLDVWWWDAVVTVLKGENSCRNGIYVDNWHDMIVRGLGK